MLSLTVHGRSDNIVVWLYSMFTSLDSIGSAVGKRPIEHAIALVNGVMNINEHVMLFDLDDQRKSPNRSGMQMSTNKASAPVRLVRNQK